MFTETHRIQGKYEVMFQCELTGQTSVLLSNNLFQSWMLDMSDKNAKEKEQTAIQIAREYILK